MPNTKQSEENGMLDAIRQTLDEVVQDNAETGLYRCKRNIFTDPELFELEMKYIFEGNWIYLAHESQIPNKNDYFTGFMGRQPIFIARNRQGELNCFINACSHRGAMLCRHKRGSKATYTKRPSITAAFSASGVSVVRRPVVPAARVTKR
jgi:benzoate/toluate 1,2-dioxygenase subunit alpha